MQRNSWEKLQGKELIKVIPCREKNCSERNSMGRNSREMTSKGRISKEKKLKGKEGNKQIDFKNNFVYSRIVRSINFWVQNLTTLPNLKGTLHSYFFLHIERSFWCFADLVTIFERFREYSKIVPLMVSQSSLLFSWLNFCRLAHTSTTEKSLENAALLLQ